MQHNVRRIAYNRLLRKRRSRANIEGTATIPRISLFRSNRFFYAQLIDDHAGKTLANVSTRNMKEKAHKTKTAKAAALGALLAERAKTLQISRAVHHRGAYQYHGQVKAFVEGARGAGLRI